MKLGLRKYHKNVIAQHNSLLFKELLYEHHIVSGNLKEIEFEDHIVEKGYFALKDRTRYWIDETTFQMLPIRPSNVEEYKYKEDIVYKPSSATAFRISAKQMYEEGYMFLNDFLPFEHTNPIQYKLSKCIAIAGYVSQNFICISSNPEFGKSSSYKYLHAVTNMSPVFAPTTKPGILSKITTHGNMVFDDIFSVEKKIRDVMEQINYQLGDGSTEYVNGSLATHQTKAVYDCQNQSITYLYNRYEDYKDKGTGRIRRYWHTNMWDNIKAMDSRFLKVLLDGTLTEKFCKNFNIKQTAIDNKMFYINQAKHLLYLQQLKKINGYNARFEKNKIDLNGRRNESYNDIVWVIDYVSRNEQEFRELNNELDKTINDYDTMEKIAKRELE